MLRTLGFLSVTPAHVTRLFDEADTDKSGTISFEEVDPSRLHSC